MYVIKAALRLAAMFDTEHTEIKDTSFSVKLVEDFWRVLGDQTDFWYGTATTQTMAQQYADYLCGKAKQNPAVTHTVSQK